MNDRTQVIEKLPAERGVLGLVLHLGQVRTIQIARFSPMAFSPGFYVYVEGVSGAFGIRDRAMALLVDEGGFRWHVQYLLEWASLHEIWYAVGSSRLEQEWIRIFEATPNWHPVVRGFGSSDYRRARKTRLFFTKKRPLFEWFARQCRIRYGWDYQLSRVTVD